MGRKKPAKDPQDDIDATCKLLCDEARNHMKVRNYIKALNVYMKVSWKIVFLPYTFFFWFCLVHNEKCCVRALSNAVT